MHKITTSNETAKRSASSLVLQRARQEPGALLRPADIVGATTSAAAKALARLAAKGVLTREAKGLYYVPKETILGPSRPSELAVLQAVMSGRARPAGATAANMLGVSTQVPARAEFALYATVKPQNAAAARVKLRKSRCGKRPNLEGLDSVDAALLEFMRDRGASSELGPDATLERLRQVLRKQYGEAAQAVTRQHKLETLIAAALDEPPRVRAMLGALLQWYGAAETLLRPLRTSLNKLTRFEFGLFKALPNAREWQAK